MADANAASSATSITFDPSVFATPQTITLSGTAMTVNASYSVTITGPAAALTINGNGRSSAFILEDLQATSPVVNTISGLTITNCNSTGQNSGGAIDATGTSVLNDLVVTGNTAGTEGGGIDNGGHMTLNGVTVSNNTASHFGGGIANTGMITITHSTISGNTILNTGGQGGLGDDGGGLYDDNDNGIGGISDLTDVTIANNKVPQGDGGGIYSYVGNIQVNDCTISGNTAEEAGGFYSNYTPSIANTIVAGNTNTTGGQYPDVEGDFASKTVNLIGVAAGSSGFVTGGDLFGSVAAPISADLGALAYNGGPTQTLLPQSGSPAIDGGRNSVIPVGVTTDQRGFSRIGNGTVDIGAVESNGTSAAIAPAITATQIGTGAAQRSSIKTVSVSFNAPVTLAAGAYTLYSEPTTATGSINTSGTPTDVTAGITAVLSGSTLTFTVVPGGSLDRTAASGRSGILVNGIYRLVLHGSKITDAATGSATLNGGIGPQCQLPLCRGGRRVIDLFSRPFR